MPPSCGCCLFVPVALALLAVLTAVHPMATVFALVVLVSWFLVARKGTA